MTIQENVLLAPYTTFRIGGAARFFVCVRSVEDVVEACDFAHGKNPLGKNLPIFVLGGGSNILVSDDGFDGLVIKNEIKGVSFNESYTKKGESNRDCEIKVGSGENWDALVSVAVEKGLHGLENLSWIPGTVGAAPVQNIGAYGTEAGNLISEVEFYDGAAGAALGPQTIKGSKCNFGYRDSIFKHELKHVIITAVTFKLKKNSIVDIEYKDLKNYFDNKGVVPTLQDVREAVIEIRKSKLPDLTKYGTAGSFFKNAVISKSDSVKLVEKYPGIPVFVVDDGSVKVPTAWILDNICGFKGARRGTVGVYENQALVLVNLGGAKATDIKNLAAEMIDSVKQKTGITISPEVELV